MLGYNTTITCIFATPRPSTVRWAHSYWAEVSRIVYDKALEIIFCCPNHPLVPCALLRSLSICPCLYRSYVPWHFQVVASELL